MARTGGGSAMWYIREPALVSRMFPIQTIAQNVVRMMSRPMFAQKAAPVLGRHRPPPLLFCRQRDLVNPCL